MAFARPTEPSLNADPQEDADTSLVEAAPRLWAVIEKTTCGIRPEAS